VIVRQTKQLGHSVDELLISISIAKVSISGCDKLLQWDVLECLIGRLSFGISMIHCAVCCIPALRQLFVRRICDDVKFKSRQVGVGWLN